MNPSSGMMAHPSMTLGHLPTIGMVTAPASSGGHVGIGIGIPIMTNLQQPPGSSSQQPAHPHGGFVSPDSSDDGLLQQQHRTQSPILPPPPGPHASGVAAATPCWPGAPFLAGMGYPLMGMGSGISGSLLGEPNLYYPINFISSHLPRNTPGPLPVPDLPSMIPHPLPPPNLIQPPSNVSVGPSPQLHQHQSPLTNNSAPAKEIIHCKSCTLFPPNPSAPLPTTREKPLGCRTVFVGGLPENMTDDLVREAFERCGEITTIRMSKKNFCHIRFELEEYVENAIYLSGFRVRIGSNSDAANVGRFHVDFAQARDDFYEWECRQRQFQREQRHRDRMEHERLPPASPPPVVHFSDHEATVLAENIKVEDHFMKSVQILITWLERGDCTKRSASTFYSMVQSTHSHLKRLLKEKGQNEVELRRVKALAKQRMQGISIQFSQVEKVFLAASHKKAWDHFTKAQRKNIDGWKKQVMEMLSMHPTDQGLTEERCGEGDDDMELSEWEKEESHPEKRLRLNEDSYKSNNQLKEENDSLRCQLEAFKNEVDLIKADLKSELEQKDAEIEHLVASGSRSSGDGTGRLIASQLSPTQSDTEVITTSQPQLLRSSSGSRTRSIPTGTGDHQMRVEMVEPIVTITVGETNCDSSSSTATLRAAHNTQRLVLSSSSSFPEIESPGRHEMGPPTVTSAGGCPMIPEIEARLIGIISTFLNVHPFGASLEYIYSFSQKVLPTISGTAVQSLLLKFPSLFRQELSGVGASLERKWTFVGFSHDDPIP